MALYRIAHAAPGRLRLRYPPRWLRSWRAAVEARLSGIPGVQAVSVSALTGSVVVEYDRAQLAPAGLLDALAGAPAEAPTPRERRRPGPAPVTGPPGRTADWRFVLASGALTAAWLPLPGLLNGALVVGAGLPLVRRALQTLAVDRRLTVDVIDALALIVLALRGDYRAAGLLVWLLATGQYLLHRSMITVRRSLRDLVLVADQPVWREGADRRVRVRYRDIQVGDAVVVSAGERIRVDGTVLRGEAQVQQQWVTGEGLPVERVAGEPVYASTVVETGEIVVRVDRLGDETAVGRIIQAVEAAEGEKPDLQLFAENLADRLVLRTLGVAALATVVTRSADAGLAILVANYGTPIRVAVPAAALAARIRASRTGILLKGPAVLERLARVDTVVFDKTGTLTWGTPRVVRVVAYGPVADADDVVRLAAAAELGFGHPVARAVVRYAGARDLAIPSRTGTELRAGLGVAARVDGARVLVGSRRFMESHGVDLAAAADDEAACHRVGASPLFVAADGRLAGMLALQDELRGDAPAAVAALRARRMRNVIMVSGDHPEPTRVIAETLGVRHYHPDLLPEQKAALIRQLRAEQRVVAMVGDGVNDALALGEADVGIAVAGGAEVAAAAAGVVLMRGGLDQVVRALDLSQATIGEFRRVVDVAVGANLCVIGLASFRMAGPFTSILISNGAPLAIAIASLGSALGRGAAVGGIRENVNEM